VESFHRDTFGLCSGFLIPASECATPPPSFIQAHPPEQITIAISISLSIRIIISIDGVDLCLNGIEPTMVFLIGRQKLRVDAKALLCYREVRELKLPLTAIMEQLLLSCRALSSPTPCWFIPAISQRRLSLIFPQIKPKKPAPYPQNQMIIDRIL